MDNFKDKVAVITGGASGMGRAFANLFGTEGCKIVIADIEEPALNATLDELKSKGIEAIGLITDVSSESDMDALGKLALETYGKVNLLFNNAGVGAGGPLVEQTVKDWEWVLGVNLWGVIHGLRVFLPHLLEHGDGHIVNTASVAGLTSYSYTGAYSVSKHGVVTLTETLFHEVRDMESSLGVSVLCPGIVKTNIISSERNRPEQLSDPLIPEPADEPNNSSFVDVVYEHGLDPNTVAEQVKTAILENQFYIWTDYVYEEAIASRHDDIINRRNPTKRVHLLEEDQSKRF